MMTAVGGTTPGRTGSDAHRVGVIGAGFIGEVHARAAAPGRRPPRRAWPPRPPRPPTEAVDPARRRARLRRRRGAGRRPRRRRRPHLHAEPPPRPAGRRPPWRPASTSCARSRSPPTPSAAAELCAAADAAGRRRHGAVRLPLLPDGPRGPGPGRRRPLGPSASSTAATCRTGCPPSRTTTGASTPSCRGPSRAFADIGSHWCDLVEFVTGDRLASVCAELVTAVPERAHAGAHVHAFAARGGRRTAGAAPVDHRGRRAGAVPHRRGRRRLGGGQPDLVRPQEPAALRDRRPTAPRWPSTRSTPTRLWVGRRGAVGDRRRATRPTSTRRAAPLRRRSRRATRRATRTASTPSSPTPTAPIDAAARPTRRRAAHLRRRRPGGPRSPTPCCARPRPAAGWTSPSARPSSAGGRAMKLGFLTACLPEAEPGGDLRLGRGARASRRSRWRPGPTSATDPSPRPTSTSTASATRRPTTTAALFDRARPRAARRSPTTTTTSHPDPAERAADQRARPPLHRRRGPARLPDRRHVRRPRPGPLGGREPPRRGGGVRARSSTTPARPGVKLIIENCVMEGWHPDGYPGNLAYSPELWEWMFSLGLYLNYDPSHLLWMGIDPVEAVRPYVDRIPHAQAKDIELDPAARNRFGWPGRAVAARRPVGRRLVALPGARPRPGRLEPARRRALRGRLRRRAVRRARGPGVGRHRGEGRDRPADRPRAPCDPLMVA